MNSKTYRLTTKEEELMNLLWIQGQTNDQWGDIGNCRYAFLE